MKGENNTAKPRFSIRHVWNAVGVQILPHTEALHSVVFPIWRKRRAIYDLLSEWITSTACNETHALDELVCSAVDYMRGLLKESSGFSRKSQQVVPAGCGLRRGGLAGQSGGGDEG